MRKTRTVALYGNSLFISSIAASLEGRPHLSVCQVKPAGTDVARHPESLKPDVLIFDMSTAQPDDAITLLSKHPRLLLMALIPTAARCSCGPAGACAR